MNFLKKHWLKIIAVVVGGVVLYVLYDKYKDKIFPEKKGEMPPGADYVPLESNTDYAEQAVESNGEMTA